MKFSIAVPSYNQGEFLERTLNSVLDESSSVSLEVIVQDANSTDESLQILSRYQGHPCLSVNIEDDGGQSEAINRAFNRSSGNVFGWLNSDDVLFPGALRAVERTFHDNPSVDIVYGQAAFIDKNDEIVAPYPTGDFCLDVMRHRCSVSQPSVFMKSSVFWGVGGLDEKLEFCMDYALWTALLANGANAVQIDQVLSATRLHERTKTHNGGLPFIKEIIEMQERRLKKPSSVWHMYETSRSIALEKLRSKTLRFLLAALVTSFRQPRFLLEAPKSLFERMRAKHKSRGVLARI